MVLTSFAGKGWAQISLRGTTNATTTTTTLTINKPAGLQVDDIMIVQIVQSCGCNQNLGDATGTGWTHIAGSDIQAVNGNRCRATLLYKIATAADVSATNFSFTLHAKSDDGEGAIVAFNGVDITTGPFDVTPGAGYTNIANDAQLNATAITTATANAAVIMFGAIFSNKNLSAWNTTSPGTLNELYDLPFVCTKNIGMGAAWEVKSSTGSTGAGTATISATCYNGSILIALKSCKSANITADPDNNTCCSSGSANFSVTASGSSLLYQWQYSSDGSTWSTVSGGIPAGATYTNPTSASMTVAGITAAGTYYYRCIVSNTCGNATSNSATLTVNPAPLAVTVTATYTDCTSATLSASNGGPDTIYYQGTTSGGTSIATPSTSQVISASGTYYFRAHSAGCWGPEGSAAVTILTPASINVNPTDQAYCSGGTANFSVVASGTPTYQWQYWDGGSWVSVANGTPAGAIYSNATTATMTVAGITAAGTYTYRCYVSNACSNATSNSATLTVSSTAPTISGTATVCVTYTTTLTASINPGTWSSSNTGIATVDASGVVTGVAAGTATITYTVTATGCTGTASVTVTTACPPANDDCANATLLPCGTTNLAGTTVNSVSETLGFNCALSKYGVWYKFSGNDMGTIISVTTTAFDIKMAIVSGSCGSFTDIGCVNNETGNGTETYSFSTVAGNTYYVYIAYFNKNKNNTGTFTISRSLCDALCTSPSVSVADGTDTNSVTMTANAAGGSGGAIAYKWYSGTSCSGTAIAGATNSTYSATATGYYSCKAYITGYESSCFSCESGLATVIVDCTPPANQPTAPTYTNNSTGTSVTVSWTGTAGYNYLVVARLSSTSNVDPISGVEYTTNTLFGAGTGNAITGTGNFVVYNGNGTSVAVTGLSGSTSYTFTVYAFGVGPPTCYKTPGASSSVTTVSYYTHPTTGLSSSSAGNCLAFISTPTAYYDDGGPGNNYSNNIQNAGSPIYRTFCPSSAGYAIKATINSIGISGSDYMTVYDAASAATGLPSSKLSNISSPPPSSTWSQAPVTRSWPYVSTDVSGCLTFRFYSDNSGNDAGWQITLEQVPSANWQAPVNSDCQTAIAICDVTDITSTSKGPGLSTNCAGGCIPTEFYSNWYAWQVTYNGTLAFTINPNGDDDYDFALYKASSCANMGAPVRCSFYSAPAGSGPDTGLKIDTDVSETAAGGGTSLGWVDTVNAKAGEYYYLMISDYTRSGTGFKFTFDGTARIECEIPPLPIDLLSFDAKCSNNYVGINWSTATETNNDYFTIERSSDTHLWETVKSLPGAGNSNTVLNYSAFDKKPLKGTSYYRLKQTDYDGHFGYSAPVAVSCSTDDAPLITYFPNPITGIVTIDIQNLDFEKASVAIFDILGNQVYYKNISSDELTDKTLSINLSNLSSGIYMVSFTSEAFTETGRIVKK